MVHTRDGWLLPTLAGILDPSDYAELTAGPRDSYWSEAVRRSMATDDEIVRALADRFRMKVADVGGPSRHAREIVSEQLARKYHALPLAVSDSTIDVAVADPRDLDCERT